MGLKAACQTMAAVCSKYGNSSAVRRRSPLMRRPCRMVNCIQFLPIKTLKAKKSDRRCGSIIAIIAGTKAGTVIEILRKISQKLRKKVVEITLDMAGNMALIAKRCFPLATQVTDRFHVQKLASEALQEIRIKYRWQAIG